MTTRKTEGNCSWAPLCVPRVILNAHCKQITNHFSPELAKESENFSSFLTKREKFVEG